MLTLEKAMEVNKAIGVLSDYAEAARVSEDIVKALEVLFETAIDQLDDACLLALAASRGSDPKKN